MDVHGARTPCPGGTAVVPDLARLVPGQRGPAEGASRAALQQLAQELAVSVSAPRAPVDVPTLLVGLGSLGGHGPVALQVLALAADPGAGAAQLASAVAADAVLATKVLRLANSAAYGLRGRVLDLPRAVAVVGAAAVSTLAAPSLVGVQGARLPARFWNRSLATAAASRVLARAFHLRPEAALATGLVSNLGAALLFRHDASWYRGLLACQPTRTETLAAELERFGTTQTEVTAEALATWSFPHCVVEAVRPAPVPSAGARCLATVHEAVARVLDPRQDPSDPALLSGGAVDDLRLRACLPLVVDEVERMQRVLAVGRTPAGSAV